MTTKNTEFSFNREESMILARCELGVGDLPRTASMALTAVFICSAAMRVFMKMSFPSVSVLGVYGVCLSGWILFIIYINRRLKLTAEETAKRRFHVSIAENEIALYEYDSELVFKTGISEIETIEYGSVMYRISSPGGRVCMPKRIFSKEEDNMLENLKSARRIHRYWM